MRAALPYLAQARTADLHQTAERDRLARAAIRARHTRTPQRRLGFPS